MQAYESSIKKNWGLVYSFWGSSIQKNRGLVYTINTLVENLSYQVCKRYESSIQKIGLVYILDSLV